MRHRGDQQPAVLAADDRLGDLQLEHVPRRRSVFRCASTSSSRRTGSTAASSGRTLDYGGPNVIPQFSTTNHNTQYAFQVNHTHVFSPNTLNEAIFASNRIEGFIGETGDFTIPNIGVTGLSVGYGVGFAQGNFIQHNYQWRDVLTHVRGAHVLKFGYRGLVRRRRRAVSGAVVASEFRVRQSAEARPGCARARRAASCTTRLPASSSSGNGTRRRERGACSSRTRGRPGAI